MAEELTKEQRELAESAQKDDEMVLQAWLQLADKTRIKASETYDEPEYTLEQNGQGFAPRGNIMALMAEMKHGKTFVNMSLAAALLNGQYLCLRSRIEDATVLFFDTEQDVSDGQRIQRRVHYVCGWDFKVDNPRFQIFHLREIPYDERRKFIDWAVRYYKPTAVFIDGVRDLLQDFNSLEESSDLIQWLMTLSTEAWTAIWTVLHVNPNSEKMRGHLGTELGNKVTDVFRVKKDKNKDTGDVDFTVDHVAARHRDVDGWTFIINDGKPYGIPELKYKSDIPDLDEEERREKRKVLSAIFNDKPSYGFTALRERVMKSCHIGPPKAKDYIDQAVKLGILDIVAKKYIYIKDDADIFDGMTQIEAPF